MQKYYYIRVGGQGILTIACIIDLAAMNLGLNVKQAEVHGMSQRGGQWSLISHLIRRDFLRSYPERKSRHHSLH